MQVEDRKRPGGRMSTRELHFIWVADTSSSMLEAGKIQALNTAIRESLPGMRTVAGDNPYAQVLVRAITFSSGAKWHHADPTHVNDYKWSDLSANGITDMGKAFRLLADALTIPPMTDRAFPPVLVLLTDGHPTDDWKSGLKELMDQPWGAKAVRIGIAIGTDANFDVIQEFIGHDEIKPLVANNAPQLTHYIRWVSTEVLKAASAPASQTSGDQATPLNVPVPMPAPDTSGSDDADDVW